WYPLWDCDGPAASTANPTIEDLTSPALREQARHIVGMGAETAEEHDLPLWVEETGPTSCPGTNDVSGTHAQALWTVDYAMTLAELGVERTAFHSTLQSCDGGAPMSPLCATGEYESPGQIVQGQGSYLALMMLSQLPDGKVLTPTVSGDGAVMVHGVLGDDGSLALVIVDLRDPTEADPAPVEISSPAGSVVDATAPWAVVEESLLRGHALTAQGTKLAGPADIGSGEPGAALTDNRPLKLAATPGTVTALMLEKSQ